jgi:hypothetical protein
MAQKQWPQTFGSCANRLLRSFYIKNHQCVKISGLAYLLCGQVTYIHRGLPCGSRGQWRRYSTLMRTTLPTLSYNPTGFLWSEDTHSSAYTKKRAYPRTDLVNFIPWGSFEAEIHQAITARMAAISIPSDVEYDIGSMPKKRKIVSNEEGVRSQAEVQLHDLVEHREIGGTLRQPYKALKYI